jgi:glycyl-tRNA synthetase beta chain
LSDVLLELGSEELPARFVNPASLALRDTIVALLAEARLSHGEPQSFGTPRRLALVIPDVAERQPDLEREVLGPPAKAAFDADGKPRPAAEGFAKSQGVELSALTRVTTPKGEYIAAHVHEAGKPAADVLPALLEAAIGKLTFPKAMRWGDETATWARPLQWICALHGGSRLHLRYGDVESGALTRGHRFLAPTPFKLGAPGVYAERLLEAKVIADFGERKKRVLELAEVAAKRAGGALLHDADLLDEVANLVEWPTAVLGGFDPKHLTLPREVLISEMKGHQRYFVVANGKGDLLPSFVAISATPVKDPEVARHGYERVLRARLADARFFFDEDRKVKLADRVPALGTVVFQQKLGTSLEKVERFTALAAWLGERLAIPVAQLRHTERAAHLCKADLTTGMVGEFPELQGVMGREYAKASGEPPEVAQAILEHYLPRFSGDRLPSGEVGAIVGIADRLDTLCGLFGIGKPPSGAADPFGLRRACLGVINVVLARGDRFSLGGAVDKSLELLAPKLTLKPAEARAQILDFFRGRLKALWSEEHAPDLVEAILAAGFDDLWAAGKRLEALAAIRDQPDFLPLAAAFKRAVNILEKSGEKNEEVAKALAAPAPSSSGEKNGPLDRVTEEKLAEPAELALYRAALAARQKTDQSLAKNDYAKVLEAVTALKPAIDLFFDKVLVMADDRAVRDNRLRLLLGVRELFGTVADLSQIQLEGGK